MPLTAATFLACSGVREAMEKSLAVGSLTLDKRYDFLLDVWARLGARVPPLLIETDDDRARSAAPRDLRRNPA